MPQETPTERAGTVIYKDLKDVLDKEVDPKFFLSAGYLDTLEKHIVRQHERGYGFGYRVVNSQNIDHPVANTLLATGGAGRERNLIYDPANGMKYGGMELKGKKSRINSKCIRTMTPNEWGRLQGFIGYAFVDKDGVDTFSFPQEVSDVQKFKQFGNSVTIPVVEEFAKFIQYCCNEIYKRLSAVEKRLFGMYGNEFLMCKKIYCALSDTLREKTLNTYFDIVQHFESNKFRVKELASYLNVSSVRASHIVSQLAEAGCVLRNTDGSYCFRNLQFTDDGERKGE